MFPELETIQPSKNLKEHQARAKKCYDFEPLKDGQQLMFIVPAFDFRDTEDSNYGQHSAELVFAKRQGRKAVTVTFYTGWTISGESRPWGQNNDMMCTGLYTHYRFKKDASEWASHQTDCPYIQGTKGCYGQLGSSLYGDVILKRLITEGSPGVWDEIQQELDRSED